MNASETRLTEQLRALQLVAVQEHYAALATEAAQKQWSHVDYLARLMDGEAQRRQQRALQRRLAAARFPWLKTLASFGVAPPRRKSPGTSKTGPDVDVLSPILHGTMNYPG